jgi:chlorobactene glucosyltransferase
MILTHLRSTEHEAPHIQRQKISKDRKEVIEGQALLVSVIITARNEEEKIERCIISLLLQTYKNLELIVVDDSSSDRTLFKAQGLAKMDSRIRIIQAGRKPVSWVGKSWPCQKGFESSKGDLLLFVDADSSFDQRAIECSLDYFLGKSLDMFSIAPKVLVHKVWSLATLPLISAGINLLYPMTKVNDRKSKRAYVFGTFILIRRGVYAAIGGHEAVREKIVEDAALAQLAKSNGYKLQVLIGDGLVTTDWESEFKSVYHGMERVFSDSIRPYGLISLLDAVLVFFVGLYPIVFALGFVSYASFIPHLFLGNSLNSFILNVGLFASVIGIICSLSISANELKLLAPKRKTRFAVVLYPLGYFLFASAIITSTLKVSRNKGLEWKGQMFNQDNVIPS